ncbi:hypothetical protein DFJ77DRAFT_271180 [Powellomyces hirtus]|nr:hypothetical protein DFJ77DRAFT_271180 [Powellomyces hirtus]
MATHHGQPKREAAHELFLSDTVKWTVKQDAAWREQLFDRDGFKKSRAIAAAAVPGTPMYIVNAALAELQREAYLANPGVFADTDRDDKQASEDTAGVVRVETPLVDAGWTPYDVDERSCVKCLAALFRHPDGKTLRDTVIHRCRTCEEAMRDSEHATGDEMQYELCDDCFLERATIHPTGHTFRSFPIPLTRILATVSSHFSCSPDSPTRSAIASTILTADNAVPRALRTALATHLDALASRDQKEFHPYSAGKVQDVIHPSLFPFVHGETFVKGDAVETQAGQPTAVQQQRESKYQWIPAEVDVDAAGNAAFVSCINQMDQPEHGELHKTLALVLTQCIPLWERCTARSLRNQRLQVVVKAVNYLLTPGQTHEGHWQLEGLPHDHILAAAHYNYGSSAEIRDFGLSFRVHRNINHTAATTTTTTTTVNDDDPAVQCYSEDSLNALVRTAAAHHLGPHYATDWDAQLQQSCVSALLGTHQHCSERTYELGTVGTRTGRIVALPNAPHLQHRIAGLKNTHRRFSDAAAIPLTIARHCSLAFFLSDPHHRVLSTAAVPNQCWDRVRPALARVLDTLARTLLGRDKKNTNQTTSSSSSPSSPSSTRRHLPVELVLKILDLAKWGMTMQEARTHRLCLTRERKEFVDRVNADWEDANAQQHHQHQHQHAADLDESSEGEGEEDESEDESDDAGPWG